MTTYRTDDLEPTYPDPPDPDAVEPDEEVDEPVNDEVTD